MYTLDINFLSDRAAAEVQAAERQPIADSQFLVYGGIVAVVALTLVGGAFLVLNAANEGVQRDLSELTAKETQLKGKITALEGQEKQLQAIQTTTGQLLNLFVGNLPVSAIADEIRKRTPITVQVKSISQASIAPSPQNPNQSLSTITLDGTTTNFTELNDYMLLLKASPLLDGDKTKLMSSTLQQATADKNFTLVNFQIQTTITSKSSAELLPELQKLGADGLVARVNLLRQQGVIK
jgi:type IV pilus assembly protein PilN